MKNIYRLLPLLFLLFSAIPNSANGQTERAIVSFAAHELNMAESVLPNGKMNYQASASDEVPLTHAEPFIAYSITWESDTWDGNANFQITFWDGDTQTDLVEISPDAHADFGGKKHLSQLYFTDQSNTRFRLDYSSASELQNVKVNFFSPGKNKVKQAISPLTSRNACPCPQPEYLDRDGWCPAGDCPPDATPQPTNVTHLIVHHSAGTNTSSDWAAVVRSIWNFHVNDRGWDDIGYNWLVDPNGVLYEGRGDNTQGAHFCAQNGGTMGVCVMGDFTNIAPTPDAYSKLQNLLSWKICDIGADPLGSGFHPSSGLNLMYISGHRDGCNTECPGNTFYPTLSGVRDAVLEEVNACNGVFIQAPTDLTALTIGQSEVDLAWTDNSDNEDEMVVERSISSNGNFTEYATLPANTTTYTDTGVNTSVVDYHYRIKAVLTGFSSLYSNVASSSGPSATDNAELDGGSVGIFPNPASTKLTLSIDNQWVGEITATLFDALGRQAGNVVSAQKTSAKMQIEMDLNDLPSGLFWVKIKQGNGASGMFKILKN